MITPEINAKEIKTIDILKIEIIKTINPQGFENLIDNILNFKYESEIFFKHLDPKKDKEEIKRNKENFKNNENQKTNLNILKTLIEENLNNFKDYKINAIVKIKKNNKFYNNKLFYLIKTTISKDKYNNKVILTKILIEKNKLKFINNIK